MTSNKTGLIVWYVICNFQFFTAFYVPMIELLPLFFYFTMKETVNQEILDSFLNLSNKFCHFIC